MTVRSSISVGSAMVRCAAVLAVCGLSCSAAQAQFTLEVVGYRGQQAHGLAAGIFYGPFTNNTAPFIDDAGNVGYTSTLTGAVTSSDNLAVFLGQPGVPVVVAREGTIVGAPSTFLNLNNAGLFAYQAPLLGATTATDGVIYTYAGGVSTQRAREGDAPPVIEAAPGQPVDVTYGTLTTVPRVAQNGDVQFNVTLAGTGLNAVTGVALYMGPPTLPRRVVQSAMSAPVTGPGISDVTFTTLNTVPMINAQGKMLFSSAVSGTGIINPNLTAYFLATPTGLSAPDPAYALSFIARRGDEAPGLTAGVTYSSDFNSGLTRTFDRYANLGYVQTVAGTGISTSNNSVLFAGSADSAASITKVYQEDDLIPGTLGDERWSAFNTVAFDGAGATASDSRLWVRASLTGSSTTTANDSVIVYRDSAGTTTYVLREGDLVPNDPNATAFGNFSSLAVNDEGDIAFTSALAGPAVTTTNDLGLFVKRFGQPAERLLQEGDVIEVEPGVFRTVETITLRGNNAGQDQGSIGFNNNDQVAVRVTFTDGTDGIFRFSPAGAPCPLDLSGNGIVDADDIFAFLAFWFAGPPGGSCTGCLADWNNDGVVTADDIFAYLSSWFDFGPGLPCP